MKGTFNKNNIIKGTFNQNNIMKGTFNQNNMIKGTYNMQSWVEDTVPNAQQPDMSFLCRCKKVVHLAELDIYI